METTEVTIEKNVVLPTKVTIKPARRNTWLPKNHDGSFRYSKTYERFVPQTDLRTGSLKTGLTEKDEIRLADKLGLPKGTLSRTNIEYWNKMFVNVPQDGAILLPINTPQDEIKYRFLLVHEEIANSKQEFDTGKAPFARYIMHSEEEEVENINKELDLKMEAITRLSKMTESDMRNFLKVYGKNPKDTSAAFIKATVGKVVEDEPKNFLNILSDPNYKMVVFIKSCVEKGFVKESGGKYMRMGGEVMGYSLEQTVDYLSNPENQEVYLHLKSTMTVNK